MKIIKVESCFVCPHCELQSRIITMGTVPQSKATQSIPMMDLWCRKENQLITRNKERDHHKTKNRKGLLGANWPHPSWCPLEEK